VVIAVRVLASARPAAATVASHAALRMAR
jgi:hypothetical protein